MRGGGDEEDRTPDLRIANATLSQLSYVPTMAVILAHQVMPLRLASSTNSAEWSSSFNPCSTPSA